MPRAGAGGATHMTGEQTHSRCTAGPRFTLLEVLFVLALAATVASVAIPSTREVIEALRTATAARTSQPVWRTRGPWPSRGPRAWACASRPSGSGLSVGNLRLTATGTASVLLDIAARPRHRDWPPPERLSDKPGAPARPDGRRSRRWGQPAWVTGTDGLRIGRSPHRDHEPRRDRNRRERVYLHGRRSQFAVRIWGRRDGCGVLQDRPGGHEWVPR